jgi:hypothetical protein
MAWRGGRLRGGRLRGGRFAAAWIGLMALLPGLSARPAAAGPAAVASAGAVQAATDALPVRPDGMFAVRLDAGRVALLSGDARPVAGGRWPHNTLAVVAGATAHAVAAAAGAPRWQPVPDGPAGDYWWLGPGFAAGGRLYVLSPHLRRPADWPVALGVDWTVFDVRGEPRYLRTAPTPSSRLGGPVVWGSAVWYDPATKLVTAFGRSAAPADGWTGYDAYAAQVPVAAVLDPAAWRYWSGAGWSARPAAARPVLRAATDGGTDTAYTAWRDGAGWHLSTRRGGAWGGPLVRFSTPAFGGAWTARWLVDLPAGAYLATEARAFGPLGSGGRLAQQSMPGVGVTWLEVPR